MGMERTSSPRSSVSSGEGLHCLSIPDLITALRSSPEKSELQSIAGILVSRENELRDRLLLGVSRLQERLKKEADHFAATVDEINHNLNDTKNELVLRDDLCKAIGESQLMEEVIVYKSRCAELQAELLKTSNAANDTELKLKESVDMIGAMHEAMHEREMAFKMIDEEKDEKLKKMEAKEKILLQELEKAKLNSLAAQVKNISKTVENLEKESFGKIPTVENLKATKAGDSNKNFIYIDAHASSVPVKCATSMFDTHPTIPRQNRNRKNSDISMSKKLDLVFEAIEVSDNEIEINGEKIFANCKLNNSQHISKRKQIFTRCDDNERITKVKKGGKEYDDVQKFDNLERKNVKGSHDGCSEHEVAVDKSKSTYIKLWKDEGEFIVSLKEDPILCMQSVCAVYRQHISQKLVKGATNFRVQGVLAIDSYKGSTMAQFLMGGDPGGPLKKTLQELQQYDSKGADYCQQLALRYSNQLFYIYKNKVDPFFLPS